MHECQSSKRVSQKKGTCHDGDDSLVDSGDLADLEVVGGPHGANQQHGEDEQGPAGVQLLNLCWRRVLHFLCRYVVQKCLNARRQ